MRLAIRKAQTGIRKGQTPFGACIVYKNKMVSCHHNVVWHSLDITAHAEIHAIRNACQKLKTIDLSGCTLYSTCEPCPMCFSAIHWAKISKVVYGCHIADAAACGFSELTISNQRMKKWGKSTVLVQGPRMRGECRQLFREWLKRQDRKVY